MSFTVEELFSYDLMKFIMNEHDIRWFSKQGSRYDRGSLPTTFVPIIGQVVYKLSFKKSILKRKKLVKILKTESDAERFFDDLSVRAASICFSDGFSMWNFLMFCTYVAAVSVEYFKLGKVNIPDCAVKRISEVLTDNTYAFEAEGGWHKLYNECVEIIDVDCGVACPRLCF